MVISNVSYSHFFKHIVSSTATWLTKVRMRNSWIILDQPSDVTSTKTLPSHRTGHSLTCTLHSSSCSAFAGSTGAGLVHRCPRQWSRGRQCWGQALGGLEVLQTRLWVGCQAWESLVAVSCAFAAVNEEPWPDAWGPDAKQEWNLTKWNANLWMLGILLPIQVSEAQLSEDVFTSYRLLTYDLLIISVRTVWWEQCETCVCLTV